MPFGILYVLCTSTHPCSQQHIALKLSIPKQTVNSAVQALGPKGYIYLERAPDIARTKLIKLTETGTEFNQKTSILCLRQKKGFCPKWEVKGAVPVRNPCETILFLCKRKWNDDTNKSLAVIRQAGGKSNVKTTNKKCI